MQRKKWWNEMWSDWKAEPWFYIAVFIGCAAVAGGATNYIFNWPLIFGAKWWEVMTAFGTVGAVITSLWLADRQRRENVQSLVIRQRMAFVSGVEGPVISVDIISDGRISSTITSVSIRSKNSSKKLQPVGYLHQSADLPVRLQHGDTLSLLFYESAVKDIAQFIERQCKSNYQGLMLYVDTTLRSFSEDLSIDILAFVKQES
ncbi:hypothetical protein NIZ92_11680 [Alcaligenes sp. 1735tsa3]|uniref:hypothetical protein n=1 Tax=Alcaligenes sp. 1735tsa3 TaxID=2953809 RepID=UPI0020A717DB|nr:hypothetical protein [Alcaligenes sp. 1735tsa3]USY23982.1 hypothetical protein NIZ92_11680 [Alcaligenes sp. 1735tsa3]